MVDKATGTTVATGSSAADGKVTFSKIAYGLSDLDQIDTATGLGYAEFTYEVSEDATATKPGVTNTTETKTVIVRVSDNGSGQLVATTADTSAVKINEVNFENSYSSEGEFSFAGVMKVLLGRTLAGGAFTFEIKDADGKVVATGSNNADGGVEFEGTIPLKPEDAGKTFTYTVSEVVPSNPSSAMDYDPTDKPVDVTITDDGMGHLLANGGINPKIYFTKTFTNIYTADGTVQLIAHKHISGRELTAEDAGKTFNYTIDEVKGNATGVTYDTHTAKVTVEVKLVDGKIEANETYDTKAPATFVNSYNPPDIPKTDDPTNNTLVYVLGGAGVAGLIAGIVSRCRRKDEE